MKRSRGEYDTENVIDTCVTCDWSNICHVPIMTRDTRINDIFSIIFTSTSFHMSLTRVIDRVSINVIDTCVDQFVSMTLWRLSRIVANFNMKPHFFAVTIVHGNVIV